MTTEATMSVSTSTLLPEICHMPVGFIQNLIFNNINATWRTGDYDEGSFEIELNKFSHSH